MNQVKDRKKKTRTEKKFPTFSHSSIRFLHICIFLVFVSLATNLFTEACLAQETKDANNDEKILTGTGAIVDENIALARNEALSEAFVKAIEEYLKIPYLYPMDTKWVIKAYLRSAKIFENKEDWQEAKNIYDKIMDYEVDERTFAEERLEWIRYNILKE